MSRLKQLSHICFPHQLKVHEYEPFLKQVNCNSKLVNNSSHKRRNQSWWNLHFQNYVIEYEAEEFQNQWEKQRNLQELSMVHVKFYNLCWGRNVLCGQRRTDALLDVGWVLTVLTGWCLDGSMRWCLNGLFRWYLDGPFGCQLWSKCTKCSLWHIRPNKAECIWTVLQTPFFEFFARWS